MPEQDTFVPCPQALKGRLSVSAMDVSACWCNTHGVRDKMLVCEDLGVARVASQ